MITTIELNKKYNISINTDYTTTLGAKYKQLTVEGILSYQQATIIEDVLTTYKNVKENIPSSGVQLPAIETLTFYSFRDKDNNIVVLAGFYINMKTSEVYDASTVNYTIHNSTPEQKAAIEAYIKTLGLNPIK